MFSDLIYEIGTRSRSAKVHGMILGVESLQFRPAHLDTKFYFECKKSGNCCTGRHMIANRIVGASQIDRIERYCREDNPPTKVRGIHRAGERSYMLLSGEDKGEIKGVSTVSASKGLDFIHVGAARGYDCQFLQHSVAGLRLCLIHEVKPLICKLAPVGLIFEHLDYGGRLLFAIQSKRECRECMRGREWTVGEWLQHNTTADEFNTWINETRADLGYTKLGPKKG